MKQTYKGSCHCGRVRYEAVIDLASGTGKCNCSYCAKVRNWSAITRPGDFRLVADEDDLGDYRFTDKSANHHVFCKTCGVRMFSRGYVEEIGGDFVSIAVATIDDLSDAELASLPVLHMNGRHDDWLSTPAVTGHL